MVGSDQVHFIPLVKKYTKNHSLFFDKIDYLLVIPARLQFGTIKRALKTLFSMEMK
jgi:hypothetical protein